VGKPAEADGGTITVESGISDETIAKLKSLDHRVERVKSGGTFGGYQGILIDSEHGTLHAGTDPRKDGCAAGY
jgi:gamma-glutamyltranspeptidase/glutathione hydrolase